MNRECGSATDYLEGDRYYKIQRKAEPGPLPDPVLPGKRHGTRDGADAEDCLFGLLKHGFVKGIVLMRHNGGADRIASDVDGGTGHIKNTVDTHDKADGFHRKSHGVKRPWLR